ncbi:MAG: hypothetical protein H6Q66_1936 [Firmicutes bacterium]|nr:hypothetical protein [Bacillota bacterium]
MFITCCFAYNDITAECRQQTGSFVVTLKTDNHVDLGIILNYTQVKVLAEGLLSTLNQVPISELIDTNTSDILGDIQFRMDKPQANPVDHLEGDEAQCLQPHLSVPMAETSLSKIA